MSKLRTNVTHSKSTKQSIPVHTQSLGSIQALLLTFCVKLRLSLLSNPDLKLICFLLLSANFLPTCSASASVAA